MITSIRLEGLEDIKRAFSPEVRRKAMVSALNKLAAQGKTQAQREIREEYNVKLKDLSKALGVKRATLYNLVAAIEAKGGRLPLIIFNAKQQGVRRVKGQVVINARWRSKGGGVSIEVKKEQRKVIPNAFIAQMRSGHVGVFRRKEKSRLPIYELTTIDVPLMFAQQRVMNATKQIIMSKWPETLKHELNFYGLKVA